MQRVATGRPERCRPSWNDTYVHKAIDTDPHFSN